MKKVLLSIYILTALLVCLWTVKCVTELAVERHLSRQPVQTAPAPAVQTEPVPPATESVAETTVPETAAAPTVMPTEAPTEPPAETTVPLLLQFTQEEEALLRRLAMAERGDTGCKICMALVMRTVLNRVESPKFSTTIKGVIYAQDQFSPAMDGSLDTAEPDWLCDAALEMVREGWDESQGTLYYEWSKGETWHSRNLNLLFTHCDTKFYN